MTSTVFMFPGQGSQEIGMGKTAFDSGEGIRELFATATEISGLDLAGLCFDGPLETLTRTANLQPAMAVTDLACLRLVREAGLKPDYVAGHSLGEYVALVAAGVISEAACLTLVAARGRLMQREAEANPGAMAAVMRVEPEPLEALVDGLAREHVVCLANYNSPKQIVASGSEEGIAALEAGLKELRGRAKRLPVSGAWHSPLMKGAEAELSALIDEVDFNDADTPILLNVTGAPESDGAAIKAHMKTQMCSGVRWYPGIQAVYEAGARVFVEIGPKSVLTNMLKYIVDIETVTVRNISGPDDLS